MNYEMIKNFPTSRNAKMTYGIACALMAREALNTGITLMDTNPDGAFVAFLATAALLYTVGLALLRFNTGRPLFEAAR